jgi:hypothetical protein
VSRQPLAGSAAIRRVGLLVAVVVAVTGCSGPSVPVGAKHSPTPSIYPLPPPSTQAARVGDDAAAGTVAMFVKLANDVTLPDRSTTPGAVYPDVTSSDVCDQHYVRGIKGPRFTDKAAAFANYGISIHDRESFAVDHLIPVSLGGSNVTQNLWPQPYAGSRGAAAKDRLEGQLRGLVCSGTLTLETAQKAIADNWWAAYHRYMRLPLEPGSAGVKAGPSAQQHTTGGAVNGATCRKKGSVGVTVKQTRLICTGFSDGGLRWAKRS